MTKKKSATKLESDYMGLVASLGCLNHPGSLALVHHMQHGTGTSQRSGNALTMPLCPLCHVGPGSIHKDPSVFKGNWGHELELINKTVLMIADKMRGGSVNKEYAGDYYLTLVKRLNCINHETERAHDLYFVQPYWQSDYEDTLPGLAIPFCHECYNSEFSITRSKKQFLDVYGPELTMLNETILQVAKIWLGKK